MIWFCAIVYIFIALIVAVAQRENNGHLWLPRSERIFITLSCILWPIAFIIVTIRTLIEGIIDFFAWITKENPPR